MELNRPFLVIQIPFNFLRSPLGSRNPRHSTKKKIKINPDPSCADRPVRPPAGARQPLLNWNVIPNSPEGRTSYVSPNSPEGRTSYEGATGIKPNETKRNETESVIERRARPHSLF